MQVQRLIPNRKRKNCISVMSTPQHAPVFLPGKFHGHRSLMDCSPLGHKELDVTERWAHTGSTLHNTTCILRQCPWDFRGARGKSTPLHSLCQGLEDRARQIDPGTCDRWAMQKQHIFYVFRIWAPFVMSFFIMYLPLVPKAFPHPTPGNSYIYGFS